MELRLEVLRLDAVQVARSRLRAASRLLLSLGLSARHAAIARVGAESRDLRGTCAAREGRRLRLLSLRLPRLLRFEGLRERGIFWKEIICQTFRGVTNGGRCEGSWCSPLAMAAFCSRLLRNSLSMSSVRIESISLMLPTASTVRLLDFAATSGLSLPRFDWLLLFFVGGFDWTRVVAVEDSPNDFSRDKRKSGVE